LIAEYKYREYAAVKKLINANGMIKIVAWDRVPVIRRISLSKLIDGGAAILAQTNRNHHIEIKGMQTSRPLVRAMLRVWVNS
jgi:hypothetical protein